MNTQPMILVASEGIGDGELVQKLLRDEFKSIAVSADPDKAVEDFEKYQPDVLILAFNTLEKAESYYLGLYRLSKQIQALRHRTLILCNKDDLKRVYELCKKEYFDDYILFWPAPYDSLRLPMTVHHALRQIESDVEPSVAEIAIQAKRLSELESLLEKQFDTGEQRIETTTRSVHNAQKGIITALDDFYTRLTSTECPGGVQINDRGGFQQEINNLKKGEIEKHFHSVEEAVQPMRQWAGSVKKELEPQLESARALKALTTRVRPVMLVVDDDELQHRLLTQMLSDINLELMFAESGSEALGILRRHRPDLILMDINLPDDSGVNITRRIKSVDRFANIPVIMITGHSEKSIVVDSMKAGAMDFVVKPFEKNILLAKLRDLLNGALPE